MRDVDLTYAKVRTATDRLVDKDLAGYNEKVIDGGVNNKHLYQISSKGITHVKQNDLKKSEKAELRQELQDVKEHIIKNDSRREFKNLDKKVDYLEERTDTLEHYIIQLINVNEKRGIELEPYN